MTTDPIPRARPQPSAARADLSRVEAASRPWWAELPSIARTCAAAALAPVKAVVLVAEAAVSLAFVAAGLAVAAWWTGRISDAAVAGFLGQLGARLLAIVQSSGVI